MAAAAEPDVVSPAPRAIPRSAQVQAAAERRSNGSGEPRRRAIRDGSTAGQLAPVLLVVPDERNRSVIAATLLREGFQIAAASSAEGAQLQLAPGRSLPSVVVSEATLQDADGFALCKQIRGDPRTAMLPVILLSARPAKRNARLAGDVGADDCIAKPAFANDIATLVHLRAGANSLDTSLRSSTDVVPLPKLLRALLAGIRSGRVEVQGGGQISFREGRIVDASLNHLRGLGALTRMLLLAEGDYTVTFSSGPTRASLSVNLEELCTTLFRQIASSEKEAAYGLPLDTRLVANLAQLGRVNQLPGEIRELVRLCDGRRTVRQCLLETSLSESLGLAVLARLWGMGLLSPAPGTASPQTSGLTGAAWPDLEDFEAFSRDRAGHDARAAGDGGAHRIRMRAAIRFVVAAVGVVVIATGAAWVASKAKDRAASDRASGGAAAARAQSASAEPVDSSLLAVPRQVSVDQPRTDLEPPSPSSTAWLLLGRARFDAGDYPGAEEAATKALELNPANGAAMMLRAKVFLATQRREKAAEELERYLRTEPDGPYAEEAKKLLSSW